MTQAPGRSGATAGPAARRPAGNRLAAAVLGSRWHRLLSGSLVLLRLRGRRSGRVLAFPVRYAREGDRLVVLPGNADAKRWWRNLEPGAPVSGLLAGSERSGTGRVLRAGTPGFERAAAAYGRRYPRSARLAAASPVLVELDLTGEAPGT